MNVISFLFPRVFPDEDYSLVLFAVALLVERNQVQ